MPPRNNPGPGGIRSMPEWHATRRPHPKPPAPAGWQSQARPVNSSTRAAGQGPPPKPGNACKLRPADGERGGSLGPNIHHMMDVERRQARARTSITQMDAVAPRSQAMPATPAETSNKHDQNICHRANHDQKCPWLPSRTPWLIVRLGCTTRQGAAHRRGSGCTMLT